MHRDPSGIDDYIPANRGTYADEAIRAEALMFGTCVAAVGMGSA
ncbi:MAG: hypothetical protein ABI864_05330 [Chloroflexota bacterium]